MDHHHQHLQYDQTHEHDEAQLEGEEQGEEQGEEEVDGEGGEDELDAQQQPDANQAEAIMMHKLTLVKECMNSIETDTMKFYNNGSKAAGTRARKHLQELKGLCQELRLAIQDTKTQRIKETAENEANPEDEEGQEDPNANHLQAHHMQEFVGQF
eukprot:CAMPEP_0184692288 /NCGR_PEP_ID=MMETSP0313-20130426/829_1 /TAXON_ID=2792 /ORGANISM="Porphyridium aerugineum, Strain SAG 1380-2" /LENGTH=154 /DNA_ID=CAMNT_0027150113 /DNA_START=317 /DNA_END=781 /DNA_ORIENTATION=+